MTDQPTASPIGAVLADRFRVDRLVGNGGMAAVYEATDVTLHRTVAVKLFRNDTLDDAEPARQTGEIALLASLNHFALVTLFDAGTTVIDGAPRTFIVMEFIDGPDLRTQIAGGALTPADVAQMGADLAEALHYVHSQGIIHRDIKPANVLLAPSGFPGRSSHAKLADFGIARLLDEARLTATGTLIGTASYLSPEQALGQPIGPPSDVYSLGLVLLECLTGGRAYPGTAIESAIARLQRQPEIPATLDREWSALLGAMTSRQAADRPSAADAAVALRALSTDAAASGTATRLLTASGDVETSLMAIDATAATSVLPGDGTAATSLLPVADTAVTSVLPVADTAATSLLPVADTAATSVATSAETVVIPTATPPRAADRVDAPRRTARPVRRRWIPISLAVAAAALVTILAVVLLQRPVAPEETPPSYPAVEGPLGTHLQELQRSVEP